MQSVDVQAPTVDEAIRIALSRLGRSYEEVEVEVLNPGSPGVLGVGAENALVRVTVRGFGNRPRQPMPPQQQPYYGGAPRPMPGPYNQPAMPPQPMPGLPYNQPAMPPQPVPAATGRAGGYDAQELANIGRDVLMNLLRRMRIQARPQIEFHPPVEDPASEEESQSPLVTINLVGSNDLAALIGRRGEVLTDLQYVFNLVMNKKTRTWGKVMIDVEGYRARRKANLMNLARRMADQVLATRQPITLEPMPAYERRLVHLALLDHPYIRTESFGEGEERKVTIFPK
jgi:spoIIIJ-associated protein